MLSETRSSNALVSMNVMLLCSIERSSSFVRPENDFDPMVEILFSSNQLSTSNQKKTQTNNKQSHMTTRFGAPENVFAGMAVSELLASEMVVRLPRPARVAASHDEITLLLRSMTLMADDPLNAVGATFVMLFPRNSLST